MSLVRFKTAMDAVFGKDLTAPQLQRIVDAYYGSALNETAGQVAAVVLDRMKRGIISKVSAAEADAAAQQARTAAESAVTAEFE